MNAGKSAFALNAAVFLLMLGVGMITALLPGRAVTLSGSSAGTGMLASALAVSFLIVMLPLGRLADRLGPKPWLAAGYALAGISGIFYYFAECVELIWMGRFVQGLGEAPVWALAPALLALLQPPNLGHFLGLYNASLHMGLTLGPLTGVLLSGWMEPRNQFLVFSLLCWLGGGLIAVWVKDIKARPPSQASATAPASLGIRLSPARLYLLGGVGLYGCAYGLSLTVLPAFLLEAKSFGQTENGLFFCLLYLGMSLAQAAAGRFSQSRFAKKLGGLAMALAGCGLFLIPYLHGWQILLSALAASLGLGAFAVCSLTRMSGWAGSGRKGAVSGLYYLAWGLGYFLGPLSWMRLTGLAGGFHTAWAAFACCLLVYGLAAVLAARSGEAQ